MNAGDKAAGDKAAQHNADYWPHTRRLMLITIAIWAVLGFGIHFFVTAFNDIVILGFPLGFYLAAQGALIGFVILIFWFSRKQEELDSRYGMAEDE